MWKTTATCQGEEMYGVWSGGARPRGRPKKTWREIVEKDCQVRGLNREDAVDRIRWKKQISTIDDQPR